MNPLQLLTDFLRTTRGKSDDTISSLLFVQDADGKPTGEIAEDALTKLVALDAAHIAKLTSEVPKEVHDKIHKEATFQALSKAGEKIKKAHQVDGDTIDEIMANVAKKFATAANSEDAVLASPLYVNAKAEVEQVKQSYEAKIAELDATYARRERFSKYLPKIDTWIDEAGAVLPHSPTARANQKAEFYERLTGLDFDEQQTGTYIKDSEGKLLKDAHGNLVTAENYVKGLVPQKWDVEKQPARQSPGNDGPGSPPVPPAWKSGKMPTNNDELNEALATLPANEGAELYTAYRAAQGAT